MHLQYFKEKIIVCLSIVNKKIAEADELIDYKDGYSGVSISPDEQGFLSKDAYPLSYIKYIKKEEWYISIAKEFPEVSKYKK